MWIFNDGVLQEKILLDLGIKHFCSSKVYGNMLNKENRKILLDKFYISNDKLVTAEQIHGNKIHIVEINNIGNCVRKTDGLISNIKGIPLGIFTADCVPVFIVYKSYNKKLDTVIGLIHAGWRGILNSIIEKSINCLKSNYKLIKEEMKNIFIALGPHICGECYYFGNTIGKKFGKNYNNGKVNLANEIKDRLIKIGILEQKIFICNECTFHNHDMLFSYRRGDIKERMLSLITL